MSMKILRPEQMNFTAEAQAIQAAAGTGIVKVVTLGQLVFFSSPAGDAWMLDPEDHFAAPLARGGDPCPIPIEETATSMVVNWSADYRIEGDAFIVIEQQGGRMRTITGYPTAAILGQIQEHSAASAALGLKTPLVEAAQERLRTGRNEPCPCGSGRKYKNCHRAGDCDLVQGADSRPPHTQSAREKPEPPAKVAVPARASRMPSKKEEADPIMVQREALWRRFKALKKPTRAQQDELLEGLLALPPDYTQWFNVIHALADHQDLPGVYRRIADAVPHMPEGGLAHLHWAAASELARHGHHALLPEVAARFSRLEAEAFDGEVLEQVEEILLAEGCEEETLRLAEHFLARKDQGARLPTYDATGQRGVVLELRAGMAMQSRATAPSLEETLQTLRQGLGDGDDVPAEYVDCIAQVICTPVPGAAWTRADFQMAAAKPEQEYLRLYGIMLRVARDAAREDAVRAGRAFIGLARLLEIVFDEGKEEDQEYKKGKRAPANVLDHLAAGRLDARVAENCREFFSLHGPRARLLLDAHDILIRFALRHQLMPAPEAGASQNEVARLQHLLAAAQRNA